MGQLLRTVVIADDDPDMSRALAIAVAQLQYTWLGTVGTGRDAIELVQQQKPNLILLDIYMPGMDGLEATRQIAQRGTTAIVVMTADTNPQLPLQAMDLGACGFMHKPFDLQQLTAVMESAWHDFQIRHHLEGTIHELTDELETRKLLQIAIGILMEKQNFSAERADQTLHSMSRDQRISIQELCRSVIYVKQVLRPRADHKPA